MDMTLFEVDEACNRIRDEVEDEANIIFGSTFNENLEGTIRVSVVATGIDGENVQQRPSQTGFQRSGQPVQQNSDQRSDVLTAGYGQRQQEPQTAVSQFFTGGGARSNNAPAQPPQPSVSDDQFIPDEPMEAPEEEQLSAGDDLTAQRSTDPFVEADLANADKQAEQSSPPQQKKKSGLFDRFTRGEDDEQASSPTPQSSPSPAGAQQSNLAVDMQEDEDLEIPAFLRRQAN
jgi:cell division protein FtsZ